MVEEITKLKNEVSKRCSEQVPWASSEAFLGFYTTGYLVSRCIKDPTVSGLHDGPLFSATPEKSLLPRMYVLVIRTA